MNDPIKVFHGLRKAMKKFTPAHQMRVQRDLAESRALNISDGMQLAQALGTLRAMFAKLERWETQFRQIRTLPPRAVAASLASGDAKDLGGR